MKQVEINVEMKGAESLKELSRASSPSPTGGVWLGHWALDSTVCSEVWAGEREGTGPDDCRARR